MVCFCLIFVQKLSIFGIWSRVMHIYVGNLIIGSDNGLSPVQRQTIIWTNVGTLLIGPLETNCSEILIEVHIYSFKKMHLKISSVKWRPFCLDLNVLTSCHVYRLITRSNRSRCLLRRVKTERELKQCIADMHSLKYNTEDTSFELSVEEKTACVCLHDPTCGLVDSLHKGPVMRKGSCAITPSCIATVQYFFRCTDVMINILWYSTFITFTEAS